MLVDGIRMLNSVSIKGEDMFQTLSQPGTLSVITGVARWYPPKTVTILDVQPYLGTPSGDADVQIDIKKNGGSIIGTPIIIPHGSNVIAATQFPANITLQPSDYLTVDVLQVGSTTAGSDLAVRIRYTFN